MQTPPLIALLAAGCFQIDLEEAPATGGAAEDEPLYQAELDFSVQDGEIVTFEVPRDDVWIRLALDGFESDASGYDGKLRADEGCCCIWAPEEWVDDPTPGVEVFVQIFVGGSHSYHALPYINQGAQYYRGLATLEVTLVDEDEVPPREGLPCSCGNPTCANW